MTTNIFNTSNTVGFFNFPQYNSDYVITFNPSGISIKPNGNVVIPNGLSLTDASIEFWKGVTLAFPHFIKERNTSNG